MRKLNNQKGFVHHLVIVGLVVLLVVGGAGYLVWKRRVSNSASAATGGYLAVLTTNDYNVTSQLYMCKQSIDSPYGPLWKLNFYSTVKDNYKAGPPGGGRIASGGNFRVRTLRNGSKEIHNKSTGTISTGKSSSTQTVFASKILDEKIYAKDKSMNEKVISFASMGTCR